MGKGGHSENVEFFGGQEDIQERMLNIEEEAARRIREQQAQEIQQALERLAQNNDNGDEANEDEESSVESDISMDSMDSTDSTQRLLDEVQDLNDIIANNRLPFAQRENIIREIRNLRTIIAERNRMN